MQLTRIAFAAVLVSSQMTLAACASGGSGSAATRQPDLISRAEIVESGASDALEIVERLRPQFLRPRGGLSIRDGGAPSPPQVFVDGLELGGPDVLRDIPASSVMEIRYERNRDTEVRLGSGQHGGVIHVRTGRSG
jgi:hypothetical protein